MLSGIKAAWRQRTIYFSCIFGFFYCSAMYVMIRLFFLAEGYLTVQQKFMSQQETIGVVDQSLALLLMVIRLSIGLVALGCGTGGGFYFYSVLSKHFLIRKAELSTCRYMGATTAQLLIEFLSEFFFPLLLALLTSVAVSDRLQQQLEELLPGTQPMFQAIEGRFWPGILLVLGWLLLLTGLFTRGFSKKLATI